MNISITRALAELKLLDKRIGKEISKLSPATTVVKTDVDSDEAKGFKAVADSNLDKIQALINNAYKLKGAIIQSNAATKVEIGGKSMTVAEAIAKKDLIEYEELLRNKLSHALTLAEHDAVRSETTARNKGEQVAAALAGEDKGMFDSVYRSFMDQNTSAVVASEAVINTRDRLDNDIDEFLKEVDFALSESNTRTTIEVDI